MMRKLQFLIPVFLLLAAVSFSGTAGTPLYSSNHQILPNPGDIKLSAVVEGSRVNLNWNIDDVPNISQVIIERSDNNAFFRSLTTLENKAINTRYTDLLSVSDLNKRSLYYRITVVTTSGEKFTSEKIPVDLGSTKNLKPNIIVSGGEINVEFQSERNAASEISVFNNTGQPIKTINFFAREGNNAESILSSDLRPGLYFLRIEQSGEVTTTKFFVR